MKQNPNVYVIDDEVFYLKEIQLDLQGIANVHMFKGTNEFLNADIVKKLSCDDCVIIDYDLGHTTAIDSGIAQYLRQHGFKGKLILWTLFSNFDKSDQKVIDTYFDLAISKDTDFPKEILTQKKQAL